MKLRKIIFEMPVLFIPEDVKTPQLKEVTNFWKTNNHNEKNKTKNNNIA